MKTKTIITKLHWYNPREVLPEVSGGYIVALSTTGEEIEEFRIIKYSAKNKLFFSTDYDNKEDIKESQNYHKEVKFWAPIRMDTKKVLDNNL